MALCSLSTGMSSPPPFSAAATTRSPPATRLSLLARASRFPARRVWRVGSSPADPTRAFTTTSTSGDSVISRRASRPFHPTAAGRSFGPPVPSPWRQDGHGRAVALYLPDQGLQSLVGGQGHHLEAIRMPLDDLQRAPPDGARGPQDGDSDHRRKPARQTST